ncbi:ArsR/SmtB family transcription factor [Shewanella maritima]|uniref:ArsR/SmtB family transcription factor n=1 Tax=Shewanella maritima TaxID=2520507 RepID=UPI003736375A
MELETVAKALKELGHPTRLMIYKTIVRAGHQGTPVGGLQQKLAIPGSTLSHHITGLVSAGLLKQRREGRTLFCIAQYDQLQQVMDFLVDECCLDESQS